MTHQNEAYLRQLQNASYELLEAYKKLSNLNQRRVDVGMTFDAQDIETFPQLTVDNVNTAHYAVEQLEAYMVIYRSTFNKIIP